MRDVLKLNWSPAFRLTFTALLMALFVILSLPGCATVGGPLKAAETVEQKAFALYGTFVVFEEAAVTVVQNEQLPRSVRRAVQNADAKAKPVVDSLLDAVLEVQKIRLQVEAGTNTTERLLIVTANLENWIDRAVPVVNNLIGAVRNGDT